MSKLKNRSTLSSPSSNVNKLSKADVATSRMAVMTAEYRGPIPPASEFAKYDEVVPGSANRILKMAEKAEDAEIASIERRDKMVKIAMISDKGMGYIMLIAAIILVIFDKPIWALISGVAPIVQYVSGISFGRNNNEGNERRRKKQET